jgi:hypothetical protein
VSVSESSLRGLFVGYRRRCSGTVLCACRVHLGEYAKYSHQGDDERTGGL